MVDQIDLFAHLDDLEFFSLLKNLHYPVNTFDISVQKEIPEMLQIVPVNKHNGFRIDMAVGPRRYTAE
jgi:hypothetical protein